MTKTVELSVEWLEQWQSIPPNADVTSLINSLPTLGETLEDILPDYCRDPRGTPVVDSCIIEEAIKSEDTKGTVRACFEEEYFYGCRDADGSDLIEFSVPFTVQEGDRKLTISWQEKPCREPDEF
jgi:hypothetical protein